MNTVPMRGRVAVVGAGPAGMATALSVHQAGHDVTLLERYPQARPAGNILNLWPPPVRRSDCSESTSKTSERRATANSAPSPAASGCASTCPTTSWPSTAAASTPVNWQELIDAFNETPSRPDPSPSEERAAVRTMFRTIADATETTADELLHAFGIFGSAAGLDVEQMISAQREAELAGTDNWEALADALSLHRYREILNATSIENLQRSAVAVFTVTTLQGMIVFMGMWPVVAMRTGAIDAVPPNLSVVGPAVVKVMTNDPVWQQWGAFQTNVNPRSTVLALAMSTLGIFMLPGFLANVEAYGDRLQRLALQLTAAGRATEA